MGRQYGKSVAINAVTLAILLLVSGRPGWTGAWLFVALMFCVQFAVVFFVFRKDPGLMRERERRFQGTAPGDKWPTAVGVLLAPIAMYVVAALGARFDWQPQVPPWLVAAGFLLCAAGALVTLRAMMANRFFSAAMRIQTDRGHMVVATGPYARVRHPGYLGMLIFDLGAPLALASCWALIPAGVAGCCFALRTVREDRMLRAQLPGYAEYAARVRYRLLPGVW